MPLFKDLAPKVPKKVHIRAYICICICICICIYICIYTYVYTYTHIHIYVYMYLCMYIRIHVLPLSLHPYIIMYLDPLGHGAVRAGRVEFDGLQGLSRGLGFLSRKPRQLFPRPSSGSFGSCFRWVSSISQPLGARKEIRSITVQNRRPAGAVHQKLLVWASSP